MALEPAPARWGLVILAAGIAACSPLADPSVAGNDSANVKGYGVGAVGGDTLSEMVARCSGHMSKADTAENPADTMAECDQLRRTAHTQPGNSIVRTP